MVMSEERTMCELFAVASAHPFQMREYLRVARDLERWGIAGMGWGVAWIDAESGRLCCYASAHALRDDEQHAQAMSTAWTTRLVVHLRRPSLLSTCGQEDAQPFVASSPCFAFAHNGEFARHAEFRPRYASAGVLHGKADTEVAFAHLVAVRQQADPPTSLTRLQADMGGRNNMLYLGEDGLLLAYAGNRENPIYRVQHGERQGITTSLYSRDRAVFDLVIPDAVDLGDLPPGQPILLAPAAAPSSFPGHGGLHIGA